MNLKEFEMQVHEVGEEYPEDEDSEILNDLSESLEHLEACVTLFDRLLRKRTNRLGIADVKEMTELAQEVSAFIDQWAASPDTPGGD
jgi:hypothetical protein